MYFSLISRHPLQSMYQLILYYSHAILILPAISIPFLYFISPIWTYWMMKTIFPFMILSGFLMTIQLKRKPHLVPISDLFISYGFSYFVLGLEWIHWNHFSFIHLIAIYLITSSLSYLYKTKSSLGIELFVLMAPLFLIHFYFLLISNISQSFKTASFFLVSLTGTMFTLSHDKYWIFPKKPLSKTQRIIFQMIPLVFFFVYLQISKYFL